MAMIEHYMYEEHEQLRCASMECMCNLVQNEKVGTACFCLVIVIVR